MANPSRGPALLGIKFQDERRRRASVSEDGTTGKAGEPSHADNHRAREHGAADGGAEETPALKMRKSRPTGDNSLSETNVTVAGGAAGMEAKFFVVLTEFE